MAKNWLDKYDDGGETPANYNSIPTGIVKPPTVIPTSGSSYYEPSEQTIYLNPTAYYNDPSVYQHEMFHHWQNLNDQLRKPDEYQGPLAKPNMLSNNTGDYYNRRTVETDKEYNDFYKDNPTFKVVNPNLIYNGVINPSLYENPKYAEGEAEDYQYYVKGGGRPAFMAKGGLIKRADGSYSKRGLWDNIRANRGSGRKPTAEMLEQERKIKKHADGSFVEGDKCPPEHYWDGTRCVPQRFSAAEVQGNNPLMNLSEAQRFPAPVQTTVTLPEGYLERKFGLKKPVLNTMGKPYATGAVEQSVSPLDFIGAAKGVIGLGKGLLKYRNLMKPNYVELGGQMIDIGAHPRAVNRAVNQMHKGAQQVALPSPFADGSWVEDSSLPTPTTPSFYPAGHDRTLTNYQMGTPKARMYAAGSTVWTKQNTPLWAAGTPTPTTTQNFRNTGSLNTDLYRIGDVIPTGMNYKTPAAGTYDYSKDVQPPKKMVLHAPDTTMMAALGGQITDAYKKRVGIPYAINPGVSNEGMYVGPTTQRGITFANGGWINKYETAGPVIDGNNPGGRTDLTYDAKTNAYYKPLADGSLYPVSQVTVDVNGTNKTLWTDSDEYKNMYGNLMSYNPNTDMLQGKTFAEVPIVADAPDTYNNYMLRKHKNDGLVGAMFGMPLDYVASFPQAAATKLFSGKYQTPSEAMDIQNPYLATGVDMFADPSNLLGVGLLDDSYKLYNASKLIGKGFKEVAQGVGQNVIETGRGMYDAVSQIPRNAYNYAFRSNRNSLPLLDNSALNTDDLMATIRQNIADRNAATNGWSQTPIDNTPSSWASFYDHPDLTAPSPNSSTPPVYTPEQMHLMNLRDRLNAGEALSNADMSYLYFDSFGNPRPITYSIIDGRSVYDFENPNYIKPKVSTSNRSGLTKEEALQRATVKDKDVISKMTEEEFANTVVKPNGEVVTYKPGTDISQVGYDAATRETKLADAEYVDTDNYVKQFNDNIDELNANIAKNNTSGVDYKVKELTPDGRLIFESPIPGQSGQTTTTWGVRIKPGKWQGTVEDIANKEYYRAIPGLEITNSLQGLFADGVVRRGTGVYGSLNDYLKNLGMGRVKPGFNSQTKYSRGLWEDAVKKEKAFGFYGGRDVVYGAMKKLGGPINKNTKKQVNGGWIEQYN